MYTIGCLTAILSAVTPMDQRECSFDIWDWTAPCQDPALFERWVNDLAGMGFNRVEISVPWKALEPTPGQYDLSWLQQRLEVCAKAGVGMRLRINSYYGGATPDWYDGDTWLDYDGNPAPQSPPAITDERFWAHYGPMCTAIAGACQGKDVFFNAFIGIHAELKWSEWWSYDSSTLALWRKVIAEPRPDWLRSVADDAPLPERPSPPGPTGGLPDTSIESRAFIAFREWCWREAVRRFNEAIHAGDPAGRISAPLGESFRKESAAMSNLDYWGLSRGASQVVHSYDFFWHVKDGSWCAAAAVDAFRGITSLPVAFEFDGQEATFGMGHNHASLLALGRQAAAAGAGFKVANYSYHETLPSEYPLLHDLLKAFRSASDAAPLAPDPTENRANTVLLFCSKWANYLYREPTQWVHEAQFGVYKLFRDLDIPVRIICEDNLAEGLSGYRLLYCAFSPRELLPAELLERLDTLTLPRIVDVDRIPPLRGEHVPLRAEGLANVDVTHETCPVAPLDLTGRPGAETSALKAGDLPLAIRSSGQATLGYPIGLLYLRGDSPNEQQGMMVWAMGAAGSA